MILLNLFRAFNYRVRQKLKRQKKLRDVQEKVVQTGNLQTKSSKTNLISKDQHIHNSFIRRHSSLACKSMPKDPEQAVAVLFHVYQQFSKSPHKSHFLMKYFAPVLDKQSQDISQYLFQMGKYKGKKDASKLLTTVQEMKSKFSSLRKACSSINCS